MAKVIVRIKIMPEDVTVDLAKLQADITKVIEHFKGAVNSVETEDVAFGLKALNFIFMIEDKETDTDVVEDNLRNVEGVGSVQITDIRRAIG